MIIRPPVLPHSPEWHARRREYVGASDVAAVLGLGRYGSPAEVWAHKVGEAPEIGNEAMALGTAIEPYTLAAAAKMLGVTVHDGASLGTLVCDDAPHLSCHLDGWVAGNECISADEAKAIGAAHALDPIPVEAKWTAAVDAPAEYDALAAWLDAGADMAAFPVPGSQVEGYYVQVQAQMAVTGAPYAYLVALLGDRAAACALAGLPLPDRSLRVLRVPRDPAMVALIQETVESFWSAHVKTRTPPTVTAADCDALRATRRGTLAPETVCDDLAAACDEIERLKAEVKAATTEPEARIKELQAQVEARILAAEVDCLRAGAWLVKRSKVERKPVAASTYYTTRYSRVKE